MTLQCDHENTNERREIPDEQNIEVLNQHRTRQGWEWGRRERWSGTCKVLSLYLVARFIAVNVYMFKMLCKNIYLELRFVGAPLHFAPEASPSIPSP